MNYSEEHVTRAIARRLVTDGWEIVAVHPPDGQGPFVVPKPPHSRDIERSSYHPDLVAIRSNQHTGAEVLIAECKLNPADLVSDRQKLSELAASRFSLLFVLFRCQKFTDGPEVGVNYEAVKLLPTELLPIQFALAAYSDHDSISSSSISDFLCTTYLFSMKSLA
jgi:hypothetical protein